MSSQPFQMDSDGGITDIEGTVDTRDHIARLQQKEREQRLAIWQASRTRGRLDRRVAMWRRIGDVAREVVEIDPYTAFDIEEEDRAKELCKPIGVERSEGDIRKENLGRKLSYLAQKKAKGLEDAFGERRGIRHIAAKLIEDRVATRTSSSLETMRRDWEDALQDKSTRSEVEVGIGIMGFNIESTVRGMVGLEARKKTMAAGTVGDQSRWDSWKTWFTGNGRNADDRVENVLVRGAQSFRVGMREGKGFFRSFGRSIIDTAVVSTKGGKEQLSVVVDDPKRGGARLVNLTDQERMIGFYSAVAGCPEFREFVTSSEYQQNTERTDRHVAEFIISGLGAESISYMRGLLKKGMSLEQAIEDFRGSTLFNTARGNALDHNLSKLRIKKFNKSRAVNPANIVRGTNIQRAVAQRNWSVFSTMLQGTVDTAGERVSKADVATMLTTHLDLDRMHARQERAGFEQLNLSERIEAIGEYIADVKLYDVRTALARVLVMKQEREAAGEAIEEALGNSEQGLQLQQAQARLASIEKEIATIENFDQEVQRLQIRYNTVLAELLGQLRDGEAFTEADIEIKTIADSIAQEHLVDAVMQEQLRRYRGQLDLWLSDKLLERLQDQEFSEKIRAAMGIITNVTIAWGATSALLQGIVANGGAGAVAVSGASKTIAALNVAKSVGLRVSTLAGGYIGGGAEFVGQKSLEWRVATQTALDKLKIPPTDQKGLRDRIDDFTCLWAEADGAGIPQAERQIIKRALRGLLLVEKRVVYKQNDPSTDAGEYALWLAGNLARISGAIEDRYQNVRWGKRLYGAAGAIKQVASMEFSMFLFSQYQAALSGIVNVGQAVVTDTWDAIANDGLQLSDIDAGARAVGNVGGQAINAAAGSIADLSDGVNFKNMLNNIRHAQEQLDKAIASDNHALARALDPDGDGSVANNMGQVLWQHAKVYDAQAALLRSANGEDGRGPSAAELAQADAFEKQAIAYAQLAQKAANGMDFLQSAGQKFGISQGQTVADIGYSVENHTAGGDKTGSGDHSAPHRGEHSRAISHQHQAEENSGHADRDMVGMSADGTQYVDKEIQEEKAQLRAEGRERHIGEQQEAAELQQADIVYDDDIRFEHGVATLVIDFAADTTFDSAEEMGNAWVDELLVELAHVMDEDIQSIWQDNIDRTPIWRDLVDAGFDPTNENHILALRYHAIQLFEQAEAQGLIVFDEQTPITHLEMTDIGQAGFDLAQIVEQGNHLGVIQRGGNIWETSEQLAEVLAVTNPELGTMAQIRNELKSQFVEINDGSLVHTSDEFRVDIKNGELIVAMREHRSGEVAGEVGLFVDNTEETRERILNYHSQVLLAEAQAEAEEAAQAPEPKQEAEAKEENVTAVTVDVSSEELYQAQQKAEVNEADAQGGEGVDFTDPSELADFEVTQEQNLAHQILLDIQIDIADGHIDSAQTAALLHAVGISVESGSSSASASESVQALATELSQNVNLQQAIAHQIEAAVSVGADGQVSVDGAAVGQGSGVAVDIDMGLAVQEAQAHYEADVAALLKSALTEDTAALSQEQITTLQNWTLENLSLFGWLDSDIQAEMYRHYGNWMNDKGLELLVVIPNKAGATMLFVDNEQACWKFSADWELTHIDAAWRTSGGAFFRHDVDGNGTFERATAELWTDFDGIFKAENEEDHDKWFVTGTGMKHDSRQAANRGELGFENLGYKPITLDTMEKARMTPSETVRIEADGDVVLIQGTGIQLRQQVVEKADAISVAGIDFNTNLLSGHIVEISETSVGIVISADAMSLQEANAFLAEAGSDKHIDVLSHTNTHTDIREFDASKELFDVTIIIKPDGTLEEVVMKNDCNNLVELEEGGITVDKVVGEFFREPTRKVEPEDNWEFDDGQTGGSSGSGNQSDQQGRQPGDIISGEYDPDTIGDDPHNPVGQKYELHTDKSGEPQKVESHLEHANVSFNIRKGETNQDDPDAVLTKGELFAQVWAHELGAWLDKMGDLFDGILMFEENMGSLVKELMFSGHVRFIMNDRMAQEIEVREGQGCQFALWSPEAGEVIDIDGKQFKVDGDEWFVVIIRHEDGVDKIDWTATKQLIAEFGIDALTGIQVLNKDKTDGPEPEDEWEFDDGQSTDAWNYDDGQ